jgi:hypothetical protein
MAEYRKRESGGVWHWYKNCSRWKAGKGAFVAKRGAKDKKPRGDKCDECRRKEKNGNGKPF